MTKIQPPNSQITASLLVNRQTIQIAVKRESEQRGDINFTEASHSLNKTQAFSLVDYLRGWLKEQHEKLFPEVPITTDLVNEVIENKYFRAPLSRVWSSAEITLNNFSYALGQLRSERKLTQEAVATKAGITTTTLQNLENMRTGDSYITILKLCKLLSIEPKDLKSQNLTELLQSRKIKQKECAEELGVTESAIYQMARRIQNNSDFTLNALIKIFDQLECEVKDFIRAPLSRVWRSGEITLNGFSNTLGQLRSERKLTQEAVATKAGIRTTTLQNLENMRTGDSYIKILKLCKLLSIEPKDLKSQNLTELLQSRKIKQKECAEELGVTESAIRQMARRIQNNSDFTLNALIKIFDQLECEVKDFIPSN